MRSSVESEIGARIGRSLRRCLVLGPDPWVFWVASMLKPIPTRASAPDASEAVHQDRHQLLPEGVGLDYETRPEAQSQCLFRLWLRFQLQAQSWGPKVLDMLPFRRFRLQLGSLGEG